MTARTLAYRGTVVSDNPRHDYARAQLTALVEQFPVGSRIAHRCGRQGTVALDQPVHVPGLHLGDPELTAVCLMGPFANEPMVFAHWDNDSEITWGVWVPADRVRAGGAVAVNRPGNKARTGARR